jgi:hypothetical protein
MGDGGKGKRGKRRREAFSPPLLGLVSPTSHIPYRMPDQRISKTGNLKAWRLAAHDAELRVTTSSQHSSRSATL